MKEIIPIQRKLIMKEMEFVIILILLEQWQRRKKIVPVTLKQRAGMVVGTLFYNPGSYLLEWGH